MKNLSLDFILDEDYMDIYRKIRETSNVDAREQLVNSNNFVVQGLQNLVDQNSSLKGFQK